SAALAGRQARHALLDAVLEADGEQCLAGGLGRKAAQRERELDVLERREGGDEARLLTDVADVVAAELGAPGPVELRDVRAEDGDQPLVGKLEPPEDVQQRR